MKKLRFGLDPSYIQMVSDFSMGTSACSLDFEGCWSDE